MLSNSIPTWESWLNFKLQLDGVGDDFVFACHKKKKKKEEEEEPTPGFNQKEGPYMFEIW